MQHNKMSAEEIRNRIILYKKNWRNIKTTNCYAYALGLDVPEKKICNYAYQPGVMSNHNIPFMAKDLVPYDTFIDSVNSDLDYLGIEVKEINPNQTIESYEWKIALFVPLDILNHPYMIDDFHFIKQYPDGIWYHKYGYQGNITNNDDQNNIIINPKLCVLDDLVYDKTLCLKLKR